MLGKILNLSFPPIVKWEQLWNLLYRVVTIEIIQAKHPSQPSGLSKGFRCCSYRPYDHCCSPQPWLPSAGERGDHEQETPKGRREVQALGREGERAVGAVGRDRLGEDVGSVGMSTWHLVAFILVLCLFHHFYGLVCRHLLKGLFHLDLIEIMQPSPLLNLFFSAPGTI